MSVEEPSTILDPRERDLASFRITIDFETSAYMGDEEDAVFRVWTNLTHSEDASVKLNWKDGVRVPRSLFKDADAFNKWAAAVSRSFNQALPGALLHEALLQAQTHANFQLNARGIEAMSESDLIEIHVRESKKRLKANFSAARNRQPKGQYSQWNRLRLAQTIRDSLSLLPKNQKTLPDVVAALKVSHPDLAPASGDALRKLLFRFSLNWKELKKDSDT